MVRWEKACFADPLEHWRRSISPCPCTWARVKSLFRDEWLLLHYTINVFTTFQHNGIHHSKKLSYFSMEHFFSLIMGKIKASTRMCRRSLCTNCERKQREYPGEGRKQATPSSVALHPTHWQAWPQVSQSQSRIRSVELLWKSLLQDDTLANVFETCIGFLFRWWPMPCFRGCHGDVRLDVRELSWR